MREYKQVSYSLQAAFECGVTVHPQIQMKNLVFNVLASVPQSIYDSWWFTVEDYIEDMPDYIHKIEYNYDYWHNGCWKECKYFKENASCCYGGRDCLKNEN